MVHTPMLGDLFGNMAAPRSQEDWDQLDYRAADIFSPHAPIDEEQLFAGRIGVLDALVESVFQRGQHAIIFGERGVGKTSITNILHSRIFARSKHYRIIKRNCTAAHNFRRIWEDLLDETRYDDEFVLSDMIDHKTDAYQLYKWMGSYFTGNIHPIFVIDEYDRIKESSTHEKMADTIKYFSDFSCRATIIIVGVARSVKGLFGGHPSIERNVRQIPMPYMSIEELRQIFRARLPDLGMDINKGVEATIVRLAQGLPGYTHLLGQNATRNAIRRHSMKIEATDLAESLRKSVDTCDEKIKDMYATAVRSTKPQNQFKEVLLACALASMDERGFFSTTDVRQPFSDIMGKPLSIPYFARHINEFCTEDRGPALIREGKQGSYQFRFADALLRPFVAIKGINEGAIAVEAVKDQANAC